MSCRRDDVVEGELRVLQERRSTMSGNFATLVDQVKRAFQFWPVFCIPDPALSQTEVGPDNVMDLLCYIIWGATGYATCECCYMLYDNYINPYTSEVDKVTRVR